MAFAHLSSTSVFTNSIPTERSNLASDKKTAVQNIPPARYIAVTGNLDRRGAEFPEEHLTVDTVSDNTSQAVEPPWVKSKLRVKPIFLKPTFL